MKQLGMLQVLENKPIAEGVYSLKLYSPELCSRVQPGQFFHIRCGGDKFALLRRPISLSYTLQQKDSIVLVYRIVGQGTRYLSTRRPGSQLDVLGPLGRGFEVNAQHKEVTIVGGGIGLAPLVELLGIYGKKAVVFAGFESQTFLLDQLYKRTPHIEIATEDGNRGYKGFVTDPFMRHIKKQQPDIVFACGPRPMLKEVAKICREALVRCQVSLEERMACGVGACLGCSCAVKDWDGSRQYARVCKDGPVFWSEEVYWDE